MKEGLTAGQTYEKTWTTTPEMGIRHLGPGVPAVLSTPAMIGLIEATCVEFLNAYMEAGEQTVGFHVDVKHLAPTRIGQKVTAKIALQELKDRRFRFSVEAVNERGVKIGEGSHRRAVIKIEELLKAGS
jgi:predicted thioesterase